MPTSAALLTWFGEHSQGYFWLAGSAVVAALAVAVLPLVREGADDAKRHDWAWGLVILAIFVAGRWPTFAVPRELNPDESQLLAGARALAHDPVFWRSVDGHTAGPLNFFALFPAGLLSGWDGYLPARGTALGLMVITFTLLHQCLALVTGRRVARAAGLAAVVFEALTNAPDLLHYSTELVPMALWTGAGYALVRRWVRDGGVRWNFAGGMLLGAMPLAKLQAAPVAAVCGLAWFVAEFAARGREGWRPKLVLVAGALLPVAVFAAQITFAGEWRNVIIPFISYNAGYAGAASLSLVDLLGITLYHAQREDSLLYLWLPGALLGAVLMVRRRQSADRTVRGLVLAALAATVLAFWVTLYPGRPFVHYWQFTVVPVSLLAGALAGNLLTASPQPWSRPRRLLVAACTVILVEVLLYQRARQPNHLVQTLAQRQAEPVSPLSARVAARARPGESLAIWGWSSYVHVETGLRQATRCPTAERALEPSPYRQFYRERYVADFVRARPALFLDSVGPFSLHYNDPRLAHDANCPELAAVIQSDYVLVDNMGAARLYRRKDSVVP